MATYSKSFSNNSKYTLILTVTEVTDSKGNVIVDVANNTNDVDWELKMTSGSASFGSWYVDSSVVLDGEEVFSDSVKTSLSANSTLILGSGRQPIKHDGNGKKTLSCKASASTATTYSYLPGSASIDESLTLTTIPRKSEVTCPSFNAGDSTNIVISKKDSSFTSTIRYVFGDLSNTIANKTKETVVGWTPNADDFYAQFPDAKQKSGIIYCDTYSGNTLIGTSETSFTCYAKESECVPDISLVVKDVNFTTKSLTNNENVIIKGISDAQLLVDHTTKNKATTSKLIVSCGDGQKITNTLNGTLYAVNSGVFTATVTDSRGFSNSVKVEKTVENGLLVDYVKLAITNVDIGRPETTSNIIKANIKGNYYNGRFGQGLKKRNVQVGDDLSGKTLYFTFPEGFRELLNGANATIIQGSNKRIKEINYTDTGEIYVGVHNGDDFYSYDTTFGETILTECAMPDDFGEVTEINTDSISYQYIFVETEEDNANSLKLTYRYRETGGEWSAQPVEELKTTLNVTELEEFMGGDISFNLTGGTNDGETYYGTIPNDNMPDWIKTETDAEGNLIAKVYIYKTGDYIELTPTISGNSFTFDGELGDNFDYKKQYEFEFYAEDELMYVSASDKPIIVTKGISVIRVGDGYVDIRGDLLQNGSLIIESGSNENGSWTKWADGTMICAKTVEGTTSFATAWNGLYESGEISLGNYAMPFAENPKVAITNNRYTGYWLESHYDYGTAQAGKVILLRPSTYANATYGLDIIAFGKWK